MAGQSNPFGTPVEDDEDDLLFAVGQEDLDKADSKFRVEDGVHEARIIEVVRETSKAGNPMITMTLAMTGQMYIKNKGWRDAPGEDTAGKEFKMWCALGASSLFKQKEVAEALHIEPEDGVIKLRKSKMVGKQVLAVMETREYQGRESSSVKSILPHPDGPDTD